MSYRTSSIGVILLYICVWIPRLIAKPMSSQNDKKAVDYFEKYEYMKPADSRNGEHTKKEMTDAIKKFQMFAHIPMTGKVDDKTMEMVNMPRCGISDFGRSSVRRKRYAIQGTYWDKKELTYMLLGAPTNGISMSEVEREMRKAFDEWERVTNIAFTKVSDPQADILVRFGKGLHGDSYPFDGAGGTLAHGFYPSSNQGLAGDVHFDDDETWVLGFNSRGTDFFWTALHEVGHSLGLDHSDNKDAIMYPFYTGFRQNVRLSDDDIAGIRYLYGTRVVDIQTATPPTMMMPSTTPYPPGVPNPCDTSFDAVFVGVDDVTYFFAGKYYWTIFGDGERNGPFNVTDKWEKLPASGIDAAYQLNGITTFFKGKNCWVYNGTEYIEGPIAISKKFMLDSSVDSIDAAFVWGANGKTYFFKDDMYWRYNEAYNSLDFGYPVPINRSWVGIPDNIDSVMTWINGKTYFFKGRGFWIFDKSMAITDYKPMMTNMYWMKCFNMDRSEPTKHTSATAFRMSQAFVVIFLGMWLSVTMNL